MPIFQYRAYDASGKEVSGELDAPGPKDAAEKLKQGGLFASEITTKQAGRGLLARRVSPAALASLLRQLSALLNAGTPLFDALSIIAAEAESPVLANALVDVRQRVGEGSAFASALAIHHKVFPEFLVRVVEAGEESGTLEEALLRVAEYLDAKARFREKVGAALVYPAVMAAVGAIVLFFLFAYVLPRITEVFADTQRALPLVTRVLFFIVDMVSAYWPAVIVAVVVLAYALKRAFRTEKGQEAWERALFKLPFAGPAYRRFQAASVAATLGHLLSTGLPIMKALDLTSKVVSPLIYRRAIDNARHGIAEGASLATSLKASNLFPAMLIQMVSTGERTGELGALLVKASSFYEREFDSSIARAMALLEPGLILAMGLIVGFIVLAILLPIFELNQVVG